MTSLMHLPTELIAQIVELCDGNAHPNALYNLLFTCKALQSISKDIICRHVYLSASKYSDSRLERFMDSMPTSNNNKIFSIRLQFETNLLVQFRYVPTDALNDLEPFYRRLGRFERLTTFSLNQKGHTGVDIALPSAVVHKILVHLPRSVTSLELDTSGCDDRPEVPSRRAHDLIDSGMCEFQHICPEVCRLMAQLKCLRLRVPRLCPAAFDLPDREDSEHVTTFPLQVILLRLDSVPGTDEPQIGRNSFTANKRTLCRDLGVLVERGHFPDIKVFRVAYLRPGEGVIWDLADGGPTGLSCRRYERDAKGSFCLDVERGIEWTEYPNRTRRPEFMGHSGYNGERGDTVLREGECVTIE